MTQPVVQEALKSRPEQEAPTMEQLADICFQAFNALIKLNWKPGTEKSCFTLAEFKLVVQLFCERPIDDDVLDSMSHLYIMYRDYGWDATLYNGDYDFSCV